RSSTPSSSTITSTSAAATPPGSRPTWAPAPPSSPTMPASWAGSSSGRSSTSPEMVRCVLAVALGYLAGAIPFSQLFAVGFRGPDLRPVHGGTVSGTSLYRVAGFPVLAAAGVLEVAKGAVGPLVAGDHHAAAALAAGAAVTGHNWSPF